MIKRAGGNNPVSDSIYPESEKKENIFTIDELRLTNELHAAVRDCGLRLTVVARNCGII